jgi:hypothetical protein
MLYNIFDLFLNKESQYGQLVCEFRFIVFSHSYTDTGIYISGILGMDRGDCIARCPKSCFTESILI